MTGFCSVACSLRDKDIYMLLSVNIVFSILSSVVSHSKFTQKQKRLSKFVSKTICWFEEILVPEKNRSFHYFPLVKITLITSHICSPDKRKEILYIRLISTGKKLSNYKDCKKKMVISKKQGHSLNFDSSLEKV